MLTLTGGKKNTHAQARTTEDKQIRRLAFSMGTDDISSHPNNVNRLQFCFVPPPPKKKKKTLIKKEITSYAQNFAERKTQKQIITP